jgi:putative two-component system response regulator
MELMRTHPAVGEDLLRPMKTMEKVLPLVRSHHERLDGSGYPDGLSGSKIPVPVRILSVVDIYDALTTSRTYRRALRPEEALNILRTEAEKGWWDAKIVQVWAATIAGKVTPAHAVQ